LVTFVDDQESSEVVGIELALGGPFLRDVYGGIQCHIEHSANRHLVLPSLLLFLHDFPNLVEVKPRLQVCRERGERV